MKSIWPAARARTRDRRRFLVAAAATVSVAALTGCAGGAADVLASGSPQAPTEAKTAARTTPTSKWIALPAGQQLPEEDPAPSPRVVQDRLVSLGYLPADAITGVWDARTTHAVQAFQAWEGLSRDGTVGPRTLGALESAGRPTPASNAAARHVEVHRERGVTLLAENGRVVRALHSSSGAGADATPTGSYSVFRKELNSWSVPYEVWLPYASYFNKGIAFHGYADVPTHPASHGCVRLPLAEAPFAYAFMSIGTPVVVY